MHQWHKKRQLVTRSGLPRLRCCVCHSTTSVRWSRPLQLENCWRRCFNKCVTSRLMSVREMPTPQHTNTTKIRSTNTCTTLSCYHAQRGQYGTAIGKQAHVDYSTNNHPPQLYEADDLDCSFMAILSGKSRSAPESWENFGAILQRVILQFRVSEELKVSSRRRPSWVIQLQRTRMIPWWHHQIMRFVNLEVSWSSKTGISGGDQPICPGIFLFSLPFVRNLLRIIIHEQPRCGTEEDKKTLCSHSTCPLLSVTHQCLRWTATDLPLILGFLNVLWMADMSLTTMLSGWELIWVLFLNLVSLTVRMWVVLCGSCVE